MKIKRFVAADMRQAMREVREEQGPDSVILSSRRIAEGIEIIAALDYDEALMREAADHGAEREPAPAPRAELPPIAAPKAAARGKAEAEPAAERHLAPTTPRSGATRYGTAALAASVADAVRAATRVPGPDIAVNGMREELNQLKEMLQIQLSSLAWNQLDREQPLQARVLRELTRMGLDPDVARMLTAELPPNMTVEQSRYLPLGLLSRHIAVSGREIDQLGGIVALVGPTGVGKTTTIAKIAARAVLRHGANNVTLVTTDQYRIGAAAQLEHYGRLLGVRVHAAHDAASLHAVLSPLRGRHTVLVDTAGLAGSDPRLQSQFETLRTASDVRVCLVLAANAQAQAMEHAVRAYQPLRPQAVILTKLDESPLLGGALSALIRSRLPLDYTTDGQRVPEDIATADARKLVLRAAQLVKTGQAEPDDVLLADRFGVAQAALA